MHVLKLICIDDYFLKIHLSYLNILILSTYENSLKKSVSFITTVYILFKLFKDFVSSVVIGKWSCKVYTKPMTWICLYKQYIFKHSVSILNGYSLVYIFSFSHNLGILIMFKQTVNYSHYNFFWKCVHVFSQALCDHQDIF